jgi:hypothetical protein
MTLVDEATLAACRAPDADWDFVHETWWKASERVKTFDEWEELMNFSWEFDESGKWAVALCNEFGEFELIRAVRDRDIDEDDPQWEEATGRGLMEQQEDGDWVPVAGLNVEMLAR